MEIGQYKNEIYSVLSYLVPTLYQQRDTSTAPIY